MNKRDDWLTRRIVDAAEGLQTELDQEGARSLRDEEYEQLKSMADELETAVLAVIYDEVEA